MFWAAAIPAMASLAGDLLGMKGQQDTNMANAEEARKNRLFQSQEASLNRQFQEQMSSTAYQRAVQDMKGAGLNPALAYQQGGASSPAGNAPSGAQATMQNKFAGAGGSARAAAQAYQDLQSARSQRELVEAQRRNVDADTARTNTLTLAELAEIQARTSQFQNSAFRSEYDLGFEKAFRDLRVASIKAGVGRDTASARDLNASAYLTEQEGPAAYNARRASETWFGRSVMPYLKSAGDLVGLYNTIRGRPPVTINRNTSVTNTTKTFNRR